MNSGLILYTRPGCPFSAKVLLEAAILGIDLDERSTKEAAVLEELMTLGGKNQTPFLYSKEESIALYESDAIMTLLHERFGQDG